MDKIRPKLTLIFKAPKDDRFYENELEKLGLTPVLIPALEFEFVNVEMLIEKLQDDEYGGVILTSPRCVEAVFRAVQRIGGSYNAVKNYWIRKPCYVVGPATSRDVTEKLHFSEIQGEGCGNGESLAKYIIQNYSQNNKKLLFPCGNLKSDKLSEGLSRAGIQTDSVVVYETLPNTSQVENLLSNIPGFAEYVIFFSPSSVKNNVPVLRKLGFPLSDIKFAAIGATTSAALENEGLTVNCIAESPNPLSLCSAIKTKNNIIPTA